MTLHLDPKYETL